MNNKTDKMNFLESAFKPKVSFWYYFLVLVLVYLVMNVIGAIPLTAVIMSKMFQNMHSMGDVQSLSESMKHIVNPSYWEISKNLFLILMLFPFITGIIALLLFIKPFNKRHYLTIINGTKRIRWSRIAWGAAVWAGLSILYMVVEYSLNPDNFKLQFESSSFLVLFIITIFMMPIQTSCEELAFRGYFAQGIAGATGSRWLALVIPSVCFGLSHSLNPEVSAHGFGLMMSQYIFIGLLFGLVSILDDGIELALGMHAANNMFLSLFVTNPDSVLQTPAVFEQQTIYPVKELIVLIITSIIAFVIFYKKFGWNFRIMNEKVLPQQTQELPINN
ncbi:MAG TPA: hypothetical protein DIT04_02185 [Dysgonomonas sp.]|nr:hypothetical protein [Dysgonomonas sp.]